MDVRLLRYFVACVENRTMHAAARAVNVSQPALSKAIRLLELELGVALLDRQPRGVTATPYGETLFRYAKMIDTEMRHALAEIDAMRGMTRGTIVIGIIPTITEVMGEVTRLVMSAHPGLKLKLRVAFSVELSPALLDGELDMAVLLLPSGAAPPGLQFEPLISTGPVVVVRAGHPLSEGGKVSLKQLSDFPWLIPDYPPSHREIVQRAFIDAGLPAPLATVEVSTAIFFTRLVEQSDLVSVVPATLLTARGAKLDLVALDTDLDFPPESVGLAFREKSTVLPGARVVTGLIRQVFAEMAGSIAGQAPQKR